MTSRRAALSGHTSLIVTFSSWLKFATMIVRSEYVAATDWTLIIAILCLSDV